MSEEIERTPLRFAAHVLVRTKDHSPAILRLRESRIFQIFMLCHTPPKIKFIAHHRRFAREVMDMPHQTHNFSRAASRLAIEIGSAPSVGVLMEKVSILFTTSKTYTETQLGDDINARIGRSLASGISPLSTSQLIENLRQIVKTTQGVSAYK